MGRRNDPLAALHPANLTVSTGSNYHNLWGSGQFYPLQIEGPGRADTVQLKCYFFLSDLEPIPNSAGCKPGWIYLAPETYLHGRIGQGDRHFGIGSYSALCDSCVEIGQHSVGKRGKLTI